VEVEETHGLIATIQTNQTKHHSKGFILPSEGIFQVEMEVIE
jgi:hypothetical protein